MPKSQILDIQDAKHFKEYHKKRTSQDENIASIYFLKIDKLGQKYKKWIEKPSCLKCRTKSQEDFFKEIFCWFHIFCVGERHVVISSSIHNY
jgi:hypothetical protein